MKISAIFSATLIATAPLVALAQDRLSEGSQNRASSSTAAYDLGAVLAKRGDGGLTIMAVTPGGFAERVKLRAGDRLLSINGVSLHTLTPTAAVKQALEAGAGTVRLEVQRDDRTFVAEDRISASVQAAGGAGDRGCGYVTGEGPTPTLTENIYPADITKVAGASTPLHSVNRHRLEAGRQVLVVSEDIKPTRLSSSQLLQRQRMFRQLDARAYKVVIVDVEPNVRYHVGAQLLPDRLDRKSILANEYWRPVVWKQVPERCI